MPRRDRPLLVQMGQKMGLLFLLNCSTKDSKILTFSLLWLFQTQRMASFCGLMSRWLALTFIVGVWATLFCAVVVVVLERMPAEVWVFTEVRSEVALEGDSTREPLNLPSDEAKSERRGESVYNNLSGSQLVSTVTKFMFSSSSLIFEP